MLTPSLEDYLEEVYRLSLHTENIRVTDISIKLGVSLPSVSKALMRLKEKKYIFYQPYGTISLTSEGEELGNFLVERNRLLQDFLFIMGSRCDIAAEAEAMEHYLSRATIDAIRALVEFLNNNKEIKVQYEEHKNKSGKP